MNPSASRASPSAFHRAGRSRPRIVLGAVTSAALCWSCAAGPLDPAGDRDLRRSIRETADRELAEAQQYPEPRRTTREARLAALGLKPEVLEELNRMAGPDSYREDVLVLGETLFGGEQPTALVTLEHAIKTAVNNNLNVELRGSRRRSARTS